MNFLKSTAALITIIALAAPRAEAVTHYFYSDDPSTSAHVHLYPTNRQFDDGTFLPDFGGNFYLGAGFFLLEADEEANEVRFELLFTQPQNNLLPQFLELLDIYDSSIRVSGRINRSNLFVEPIYDPTTGVLTLGQFQPVTLTLSFPGSGEPIFGPSYVVGSARGAFQFGTPLIWPTFDGSMEIYIEAPLTYAGSAGIPEPGTIGLLLVGGGCLAVRRRKRSAD